jgi:hypothetical protein
VSVVLRTVAAAVLALGLAGTAAVGRAAEAVPAPAGETPAISAHAETRALRLVIPIPRRGDVAIDLEGRGVVVRFPASFDASALAGLGERHPGWIQDLRYGFDSLYLEPVRDARVELKAGPGVHEIWLVRSAAAVAAPAAVDDGSALRLDRLEALTRGRGGDRTGARARLRDLMERHPDDVQTLLDLVEQERELGRWRDAIALYNRALALDADAPFMIEGKAALLYEHGPMVRASFDLSDVEDEDEQLIWVLESRAFAGADTVAALRFEYRDVDDPQVQNPAGFVESFSGRREFASLSLERPAPGGGDGRLELHAGAGRPGLTLGWRRGWNPGTTRFHFDAWRPYWDFVEGIAHGGYRHRAELGHRWRTREPWTLEAALNGSRYGLDGDAALADAWGLQLASTYTVWRAEPRISLEYYFDTERFGNVRERVDAAGNRYAPVGFNDREVHQVQLAWDEQLTDYVRVGARGGYTVDRYNGRGHHFGVDLAWQPLPGLEIGARFNQSITSARGVANALNSFGGFLMIRL